MSHHKTSRELHGEHEDARNEAALRLRTIAGLEHHARASLHARLVGVLVQRTAPHHFHDAVVRPVSPRRGWGFPDEPGGTDSTDFLPGGIV